MSQRGRPGASRLWGLPFTTIPWSVGSRMYLLIRMHYRRGGRVIGGENGVKVLFFANVRKGSLDATPKGLGRRPARRMPHPLPGSCFAPDIIQHRRPMTAGAFARGGKRRLGVQACRA